MERLERLGAEQEELKAQLQAARAAQNYAVVSAVQDRLDASSTALGLLIEERGQLVKQLRQLEK